MGRMMIVTVSSEPQGLFAGVGPGISVMVGVTGGVAAVAGSKTAAEGTGASATSLTADSSTRLACALGTVCGATVGALSMLTSAPADPRTPTGRQATPRREAGLPTGSADC